MVKSKHYLNLADKKFIHRFSVFSREWFFWCLKQCDWCRLSKILVWYVQCRIPKPVVIINNSTMPCSHLGINCIIRINVAVMCRKQLTLRNEPTSQIWVHPIYHRRAGTWAPSEAPQFLCMFPSTPKNPTYQTSNYSFICNQYWISIICYFEEIKLTL